MAFGLDMGPDSVVNIKVVGFHRGKYGQAGAGRIQRNL